MENKVVYTRVIGIYRITNNINGKVYIGQSVDCFRRLKFHKLHENQELLVNTFNKYGISNFSFDIIHALKEASTEELNDLETMYIEYYKSCDRSFGYNLRQQGGSHGKHAISTCEKISKALTGKKKSEDHVNKIRSYRASDETKEKLRQKALNRSEETLRKMSESAKVKIFTEEHRRNIGKAGMKRVRCIDTGEIFDSVGDAAEHFNAKGTHISRVCKGKRSRTRGFRFEYVIEENSL